MKRSLTLFAIVSLLLLACGYQSSAAQALASPSSAGSADSGSRFGIDYVYPLQATYRQEKWPQLFAETGAGWVNFADVGWNAIEPNPPDDEGNHTYKWRKLDRAVKVWQKYGFHITISLRLGNGWFAGPIKYRPGGWEFKNSDRLPAEEYIDDYRAWIAALVERYDGDGVDDMRGLREPILYYQVGNEYANPAFWTGTPEDYEVLLDMTREAARSASPDVQIISNGIRWNDAFHNDPNAEHFEETFAAFLERLPSDVWREAWQRYRRFTELTVSLADGYDILDAGGNGPYETSSAGYMAWVRQTLEASGFDPDGITIWDMEARSEPRLTYNEYVQFHPELTIPDGEEILCALKNQSGCTYDHDTAEAWYRAEQSRVLVKVFVTRFAAGFEKVFMGMPNDWDKSLAAFTVQNPFIGLTSADGRPWPAFYALKLLVEKLDGFARAEKMPAESGVALYRFTFDDGRAPVWVAWVWDDPVRGMDDPLNTKTVRLDIFGPVTMYTIPTTMDGSYETTQLEGGPEGLVVELSSEPIILQEQ